MASAGETQTVSEYIVHHLTNLTYGKLPAGFERYDGSVVPEGGENRVAVEMVIARVEQLLARAAAAV